jgi:SAM-dependent methyltransferase
VGIHGIRFRSAADIGCGTALFAHDLCRRSGVPVFAVDSSRAMLQQAWRRSPDPGLSLLHQDIRRLRLPSRVDLVTANFDTLNHVLSTHGMRRTLSRVYHCLRPGGHFVFDIITPNIEQLPNPICRTSADGGFLWQMLRPGPRPGLFRSVIAFRGADGPTRIVEIVERTYGPRRMCRLLRESGFSVRGVHDARTLEPAAGCPPSVVIVARKPAGDL